MEKIFVAQRVFNKLVETEEAVDTAFAQSAELMSVMLQARKDLGANIKFADDAQAKLMDAIKAMSDARTAMCAVHNQLGEAKLRIGIRTSMGGVQTDNAFLADEAEPATMRKAV